MKYTGITKPLKMQINDLDSQIDEKVEPVVIGRPLF